MSPFFKATEVGANGKTYQQKKRKKLRGFFQAFSYFSKDVFLCCVVPSVHKFKLMMILNLQAVGRASYFLLLTYLLASLQLTGFNHDRTSFLLISAVLACFREYAPNSPLKVIMVFIYYTISDVIYLW